ncbi:type I restriction endonuclease subunit R [Halonatronum saccharophilum]|uniref:type I restriction endonuclease subunit R n=1 Tax=Halonatronum saccharophilum TaxID=150060 RepID=UPI000480EFD2|nr:type I restriction endonuclease subunit R [Halonatronum saccharophilum]
MPYMGNEETLVELPAIKYLTDNLGYDFVHGDELAPESGARGSYREVILQDRLTKVLKRLNPWMNNSNLHKAINYLSRANNLGASLLEINEKIYDAIVKLELSLEQIDSQGRKDFHTVKYIDFDNPENNEFLVVRQLKIQGINQKCYPDLIIYINGIPVVVIECKSPFKEQESNIRAGKKDGYEQLRRYMNARGSQIGEGVEQLFYSNFITGILNKYHGYLGTISSKYNHYLEWKNPYPFKKSQIEDVENNGQNIFLQGVLEKKNLLDMMKNFIIFETEDNLRLKKVSRYQQFRAVNKALKRILTGKSPLEKGGVIWHTQGSGKSLSMVMLARKIRREVKLRNSTIVVITDRVDLDKQIYNTFVRVFPELTEAEKNEDKVLLRADTVEEMKRLLAKAQPKIIMTTIHKFQSERDEDKVLEDNLQRTKLFFEKEIEVLTEKENLIVMTDEAHRSQYSSLAQNMRRALPNATFIGFTGTPIEKDDKNTYRTFGQIIDEYTINEAVEDGATLAIIYEGRKPNLHLKADTIEEAFNQVFADRSKEEKEAIKDKYANKRAIAEGDERIEEIARDMLIHYRDNIYPNGFKAQIVCVSRIACVKYYNALTRLMKEVIGEELEAKVIFSCDNNDKPFLRDHQTTKKEQSELIKRFKQPIEDDKLCFLIVKDMLLTGFDAPIEQVMYLDRPLREHTLLQAIARVNRTYGERKKYGFVIDYYGISTYLEEALEIFDGSDIGEPMEDIDLLYNKMLDYKEGVMNLFRGIDKNDIDAVMRLLEPDDKRAEFEMGYKRFSQALEALMPNHVSKDDINDLKWLSYVRAGAKARFAPEEELDISDCGEKARAIISKHLQSKGVEEWITPITLFENDFKDKIDSLGSDEALASGMEHAIKHTINVKMEDNPVHYTSLLEKLRKILEETEHDWQERKQKLQEFIHRDLDTGEENEAKKLGFNTKREYALYEVVKDTLIAKEQSTKKKDRVKDERVDYISQETIDLSKEIALDIAQVIKENYLIGWTKNQAKMDQMEKAIYQGLIKGYIKKAGLDKIKQMKNPLLQLAKRHYYKMDN